MEQLKSERVADQQEILEFLTSVIRVEIEEPVPIMVARGNKNSQFATSCKC